MQDFFYALADSAQEKLTGDEVLNLSYAGESSDFVRFNQGKVRQPGHVVQHHLGLQLVRGQKHASLSIGLCGQRGEDKKKVEEAIASLRPVLDHVPDDPHLLLNEEVHSSEDIRPNQLPGSDVILKDVLAGCEGHDFVGIYAGGAMYRGFANSRGQRNFFQTHSYNLDWSLYAQGDKAVKCNDAGFAWDAGRFGAKMEKAAADLEILKTPAKSIEPGKYKVYLSPAAVAEIMSILAWGSFGIKNQRTKQSALLHMVEEDTRLHSGVHLLEDTQGGAGPAFGAGGFLKPERTALIQEGRLNAALVSPRSAKEFGLESTGASAAEMPQALAMAPGDLPQEKVLESLGTGIYVNNLWYLNYSDRAAARLTGMTRFATLWVEDGKAVAPLNVMRFDDTVYRMFGENLLALTQERDFMLDPGTYESRSTDSLNLPGALIDGMMFTL